MRAVRSLRWEIAANSDGPPNVVLSVATGRPGEVSSNQKAEMGSSTISTLGGRLDWTVSPSGETEIRVRLSGDASRLERSKTLSVAFDLAFRLSGVFSIHSAGLVSPEGKGVLFIGASGVGKTTLTLKLLKAGWKYLSDDQVALDTRADAGVWGAGFRRSLTVVESEIAQLCGEVENAAIGGRIPDKPHKRRLDGDRVFPGRFQADVKADLLMFPVRDGSQTETTSSLGRPDALARLVRCTPWSVKNLHLATEQLKILTSLSLQCPAYALRAGSDFPVGMDIERLCRG